MSLSNSERLGCYAMLRSLWSTGSDYLSSFERMLVSVLKQHVGVNITIDAARKEYLETWKIDVPRMPMIHLFSRLSNRGIVRKRRNDQRYIIIRDNISEKDAVSASDVSQMTDRFESIVNECCSYCLNHVPSIQATPDQIRRELTSFLAQQGTDLVLHINNHIIDAFDTNQSFYRVGLYIKHLNANDPGKLRFLNDIAVGHILCKCLFLDGESVNTLSDLTIYLDTDIIFILLGIDLLERTEDYQRLVSELHGLGATLKVFQHSIDEVNIGLDSAIAWINSPDYDPALASKAARFFIENNTSVAQIEMIQSSLISTLSSRFDISVETASYDTALTPFNQNENTIQEIIRKNYIESSTGRTYDADDRSITRDAISVNQVYRRRCGASSPNLSECKYVMVTTNVTLAKAIKDFEKNEHFSENCIAACITDALIGTLVWLSQPTRIEDESYSRLNALARASFMPSENEIAEFSRQINDAHKRGAISDKECYLLRTAQVSREMLKRLSNGIPTKINETTPEEVLKMILAENEAKTRKGLEAKYNEMINTQKMQSVEAIQAQKNARAKELKDLKQEKKIRLQELYRQKATCQKSIKTIRWIIAIAVTGLFAFAIIKFCSKEWFWGVIGSLPMFGSFVFVVIRIIIDKKFDLNLIIQKLLSVFLKSKENKVLAVNNDIWCLEEELGVIDNKLSQL